MLSYQLSEMADDVESTVASKLKNESIENDSLCNMCFNTVLSESQCVKEECEDSTDPLLQEILEPKEEALDEPLITYELSKDNLMKEEYIEEEHLEEQLEEEESAEEEQIDNEDAPKTSAAPASNCLWCQKSLLNTTEHSLPEGPEREIIATKIQPRKICRGSKVCEVCWERASSISRLGDLSPPTKGETSVPTCFKTSGLIVLPNYRFAAATNKRCFVPHCTDKTDKSKKLSVMPPYLRKVLLEYHHLFVPQGAVVCHEHGREYYRDWTFLKDKPYKEKVNANEIVTMLNFLREDHS